MEVFLSKFLNLLLSAFGKNLAFGLGTYFVHEVSWFSFNLPYFVLDYLKIPWIESYKIQIGPSRSQLLEALKKVLQIHLFIYLPLSFLTSLVSKCSWEIPTLQEVLVTIPFFLFMEDFSFYWSHRLFHTSFFYKSYHKQHHFYQAPFSLTAEFAHPVEIVVGNLIPLFSGFILLNLVGSLPNVISFWCWLSLRIFITTEVHSGYVFPWNLENILGFIYAGTRHHDLHHEIFNGNYSSTLTYLDYVFGTIAHKKVKSNMSKVN